jgi:hypothetical protein
MLWTTMQKQKEHKTLTSGENSTKILTKVLIKVWIPKAWPVHPRIYQS